MSERFYTLKECQKEILRCKAEMVSWFMFKQAIERGDTVFVDESFKEPRFRIVKKEGFLKRLFH